MNRTLNNAFPIVAAALGNKLGVKVQVGGRDAQTDGEIIQLPAYDGNEPNFREVAWGYLAHEAGHVRYTDMEYFRQVAPEPLRKMVLNILEDVRIERSLAQIYPGTRLTIERMIHKLIDSGDYQPPQPDSHPAGVLQAFLLFELRARELGQTALKGLAERTSDMLEERFSEGLVTRLYGLLSEVPALESTRDCLRLTDRILRMIQDELDKEMEAKAADNGNQGGQDDNSQTAATDQNDTPNEPSDEEQPGQPAGGPGAEEHYDSDAGIRTLEALLSAGDGDVGQDLFEAARDALQLAPSQAANISMPSADDPPQDAVRGRLLLDQVRTESGMIRASLQGLIQASRLQRPEYKRVGNRVAGYRLTRLATGDTRVFVRNCPKAAPNTAVHILVDRSSSMLLGVTHEGMSLGTRMRMAWEAAVALVLALEGIAGVNPAISAFPGQFDQSDRIYRVIGHGQRVGQREASIGVDAHNGSTPMAEALWYAASQVMACREPRKVILALTDGAPNDANAVRDILSRCAATGIEVVGVGLGIEVQHLFAQSIAIMQIRELRTHLFELSRNLLIAA